MFAMPYDDDDDFLSATSGITDAEVLHVLK
jgi:hypothetical protein